MNAKDSIEITAPTIEKAITQALVQLGADQDDVEIEVLSTPRAGVLGLGARQARVRVTRRAPEGASTGVTSPPPAPPITRDSTPAPARTGAPPQVSVSAEVAAEPVRMPASAPSPLETKEIEREGESNQ